MARKTVLEGGKRDEILNAALELFVEKGYDGTSVRMILDKVGGEVGMFYHYFNSKQEVFDQAFEVFMKRQGNKFTLVLDSRQTNATLRQKVERLVDCYDNSMQEYKNVFSGKVHWTVASALHDMTIQAMRPAFQNMMVDVAHSLHNELADRTEWSVQFLLNGIGGVLHEPTFESKSKGERVDFIVELVHATINKESVIGKSYEK